MGGNVFETTARRLDTPQLLLLLAHTKKQLGPFFSGLEITRFFEEKTTHGDLDVLCGLWTNGDGWKGANESGMIHTEVTMTEEMVKIHEKMVRKYQGGKEEEHEWERKEVEEFCKLLAERLGAKRWAKNGFEVSFAVPCKIIDEETEMPGEEDFYQIDLVLVRPPNLAFLVITQSYGVTSLLFAAAVRRLSSSFTCHNDRFVLRYTPYNGLKAIEVELTHDPEVFMEWAGLSSQRFHKGFKTEEDYWRWLTCLPEDEVEDKGRMKEESIAREQRRVKYDALLEKRFPLGWKRMAGKKKEVDTTKIPKGHGKARLEVMSRFREWLSTTIYGLEAAAAATAAREKEKEREGQVPDTVAKDDQVSTDATQVTEDLMKISLRPTTPPPPIIALPTLTPRELSLIDPEKPLALSYTATSALKYFKAKPQWEQLLESRKKEAEIVAERQKRNSKAKTAVQIAKEDRKTVSVDAVLSPSGPGATPFSTPVVAMDMKNRKVLGAEGMDKDVSV